MKQWSNIAFALFFATFNDFLQFFVEGKKCASAHFAYVHFAGSANFSDVTHHIFLIFVDDF